MVGDGIIFNGVPETMVFELLNQELNKALALKESVELFRRMEVIAKKDEGRVLAVRL